jgi:HD-like signal output (HDOD) protein
MPDIKNIIKKIRQLHPIPTVVHKLLTYENDPDSDLEDFVRLVEHDPALTANLLKICNSAHFGLPVKVDSLEKAVSLLGQQRVIELVLEQSLSDNLNQAQKGYRLEKGELWKQSVAVALIARTLAERRGLGNLPAIYTAALLKDIGKIVLSDHVHKMADKIQRMIENKGLSFLEAEQACIGMDHAELGGLIAKQWNFSSHLVFMIENHHLGNPKSRKDPATAAIYLSDMVAMMAGTCIGVDRLAYPVYESLFSNFFLTRDELQTLILAYEGHIHTAELMFEARN